MSARPNKSAGMRKEIEGVSLKINEEYVLCWYVQVLTGADTRLRQVLMVSCSNYSMSTRRDTEEDERLAVGGLERSQVLQHHIGVPVAYL